MTCDDCRLNVSSLIDGEIPDSVVREVFRHLGSCEDCWTYYQRAGRLHRLLDEEANMSSQASGAGERRRDDSVRSHAAPDRQSQPFMQRRRVKSAASFWLGAFVAFVTGILVTLLLTPVNTIGIEGPGDPALNGWNKGVTMNAPSQTGIPR